MKKFQFSVIASGLDPEAEDFADRFFDAGCDDATISFQKGRIILDFARESNSVDAAICSAIDSVEKAGARVNRIEPDPLVNLSDIAARTGLNSPGHQPLLEWKPRRKFPYAGRARNHGCPSLGLGVGRAVDVRT